MGFQPIVHESRDLASAIFPKWVRQWLTAILANLLRLSDKLSCYRSKGFYCLQHNSHIAKFMGPALGQPGSCRPQMGPMLAPWTLLSVNIHSCSKHELSVEWLTFNTTCIIVKVWDRTYITGVSSWCSEQLIYMVTVPPIKYKRDIQLVSIFFTIVQNQGNNGVKGIG